MPRPSRQFVVGERFADESWCCYAGEAGVHVRTDGRGTERLVLARCDCGVTFVVRAASVLCGETKSCGCRKRILSQERLTTHGASVHADGEPANGHWVSWLSMRSRSRERGTPWDPRWETYEGFLANPPTVPDGHEWSVGMNLARVGDVGNYSPENARWRTNAENTEEWQDRDAIKLSDGSVGYKVAMANGISNSTFNRRVRDLGWTPDDAATKPLRAPRDPWIDIAAANDIKEATFRARVSVYGWSPEDAATRPVGERK